MQNLELDGKTRIQLALKQRGSSQVDIGRRAGVHEVVVSRVLAGRYGTATAKGRRTRGRVIDAVAEVLGLSAHEIDGLVGVAEPESSSRELRIAVRRSVDRLDPQPATA